MPKADIHPTYHKSAKVKCACGATHTMGATQKEIQVEICSNCHPFYTGEKKLIDTAGRVEKFQARRKKATSAPKKKKEKQAKRAKKKTAKAKNAKGSA